MSIDLTAHNLKKYKELQKGRLPESLMPLPLPESDDTLRRREDEEAMDLWDDFHDEGQPAVIGRIARWILQC